MHGDIERLRGTPRGKGPGPRKGSVGLHIVISNQSGKPIYEQIAEQIKALIISGELQEGDALPSHAAAGKGAANQRYHHKAGL